MVMGLGFDANINEINFYKSQMISTELLNNAFCYLDITVIRLYKTSIQLAVSYFFISWILI